MPMIKCAVRPIQQIQQVFWKELAAQFLVQVLEPPLVAAEVLPSERVAAPLLVPLSGQAPRHANKAAFSSNITMPLRNA